MRARLVTAATTSRPFAERLALFWANHFTVSLAKNGARGVVGAFEREAIRPHITGRFETLLRAAVLAHDAATKAMMAAAARDFAAQHSGAAQRMAQAVLALMPGLPSSLPDGR